MSFNSIPTSDVKISLSCVVMANKQYIGYIHVYICTYIIIFLSGHQKYNHTGNSILLVLPNIVDLATS